jgi:hypothetical protein
MEPNDYDEVITDDVEDTSEAVEEVAEEAPVVEKPKRTPQEEYEYHMGRAKRAAKKAGLDISEEKSEPVKSTQPKPNELTDGQIAILRTEGIKSKAELALFTEIMSETGKGALDLLDSNYFKSRLADFRETQESVNAIPKGRNRSGQTGTTDTDIAIATYKATGELPADFKTRSMVINAIAAEEDSAGMFTGPSVIGPQRQS